MEYIIKVYDVNLEASEIKNCLEKYATEKILDGHSKEILAVAQRYNPKATATNIKRIKSLAKQLARLTIPADEYISVREK